MITAQQAQNLVAENLAETPLYKEILDKLNKLVEDAAKDCLYSCTYNPESMVSAKDLPEHKSTMKRIKKDFKRRGFTFHYRYTLMEYCDIKISWKTWREELCG